MRMSSPGAPGSASASQVALYSCASDTSSPSSSIYEMKSLIPNGLSLKAPSSRTEAGILARQPYCKPGIGGLFASRYAALCAIVATLGSLTYGFDQGLLSVILVEKQFLNVISRIDEKTHPHSHGASASFWKGLLTSVLLLGAMVGSLNQGWIADRYSRKYAICVGVVIFVIGSSIQTATVSYDMLVTGRFIGGIGMGMLATLTPLYISEISPAETRGTLLTFEEVSITVGIVVAFWMNYGTYKLAGEIAWRLPFGFQMVPAIAVGIGILFLPFSPRWLVSRGRDNEALATLSKLRQLPPDDQRVQMEWLEIRAEVALQKEVSVERHPRFQDGSRKSRMRLELASWGDLFRKGCIKRTHVGVVLFFFQQFAGINALNYYSPTLFKEMGNDQELTLQLSGVTSTLQVVGLATSIYTMDRFGRRRLLLVGAFFIFSTLVVVAVLVGLYEHSWPTHKTQGWAAAAMLFVYMLSFSASWGPTAWTVPAEIFPMSLRAKGLGISVLSKWIANFIIGIITPPMIQNTGYGTYVFFAAFTAVGAVWIYFCVPETKGVSLEEMDKVFGDMGSVAEQERRQRIERELLQSNVIATESKA